MSDFDDAKKTSLESSIAAVAGVDASAVTVAITPGSVLITATIAVPASKTAAAVQTSLANSLGTADDASTVLGIDVESEPSIAVTTSPATPVTTNPTSPSPPPPTPSPPPGSSADSGSSDSPPGATGDADDGKATPLAGSGGEMNTDEGGGGAPTAAIGGGAAVAILLMVGLGCYYLGKKRMAGGSQSPIALTAVSLSPTKEKDLESGAPATKGSTATYSVELTKTPMGLGLSLANDVVTEVKPDSQAARDGRIKVWASSRVTVRVKG